MNPIHIYKTAEEFDYLRKAGRLACQALGETAKRVTAGISTWELDRFAEEYIRDHGAIPTFKGYLGFPSTVCVAVNHEVVHGIPSKNKILKDGDIISLDIGVTCQENLNGQKQNFVGDNATTVAVGKISPKLQKLINDTLLALEAGVAQCKPGNKISDIAKAIEEISLRERYGSIKEFGGHGIGPEYHSAPFIPNFTEYFMTMPDLEIKTGMVLAIEPMFTLGLDQIRKLKDNWTIVTKDNKPAAHFEYSVLIDHSENGHEILTKLQ